MKILVISDSHNVILDSQVEEIKKHGDFDMLIHCGDRYKDGEKFANMLNIKELYRVPGNCDFDVRGKQLVIMESIECKNILITHGHMYGVKSGIEKLMSYAEGKNAYAVIYGHTHCAQNEVLDNILFFNPGSTIFPRDGRESFGIIEITPKKILGKIIFF